MIRDKWQEDGVKKDEGRWGWCTYRTFYQLLAALNSLKRSSEKLANGSLARTHTHTHTYHRRPSQTSHCDTNPAVTTENLQARTDPARHSESRSAQTDSERNFRTSWLTSNRRRNTLIGCFFAYRKNTAQTLGKLSFTVDNFITFR